MRLRLPHAKSKSRCDKPGLDMSYLDMTSPAGLRQKETEQGEGGQGGHGVTW